MEQNYVLFSGKYGITNDGHQQMYNIVANIYKVHGKRKGKCRSTWWMARPSRCTRTEPQCTPYFKVEGIDSIEEESESNCVVSQVRLKPVQSSAREMEGNKIPKKDVTFA